MSPLEEPVMRECQICGEWHDMAQEHEHELAARRQNPHDPITGQEAA